MIAMAEGSGQHLIAKRMHRSRLQDQETTTILRVKDPVSIAIDIILSLLNLQTLLIVHMGSRVRFYPLIEIPPLGIGTAGDKIERIA